MAWTAGVGRSHFDYRAGVVFRDAASLRNGLKTISEADEGPKLLAATKVAFAFTGEGSEWVGMGQALYESEPVVRAVLDRSDAVLREERGASLLDAMFGRAEGALGDPAWTQPATVCAGVRVGGVVGERGDSGRARWSGRVSGSLRQRRRRGCSAWRKDCGLQWRSLLRMTLEGSRR